MLIKRHFEISFLYNPFLIVLINFLYLIVFTSIFMILAINYGMHVFIFLLPIVWFIPFIFRKKIIIFFSKNATLDIDSEGLSIVVYDIKTAIKEKEYHILYSSLTNYSVFNSTKYNAISISLYNIDGGKYSFNFELEKKNEKASNISEAVFDGIKSYNSSKEDASKKIIYYPSFLSRKSGQLLLVVIGIGWAILTICIFLYKPKISIVSIFGGILFYITILAQQKADLKQLKKSLE